MIRILTLIAGLFGATGLSQFPEFSQQYLQRLAGAVDELERVVADFDSSAEGVGMTRDQALAALNGGEFQQARRADMERTITRSERLSADLAVLRDAPMVRRALQPQRFMDAEIAAAAWEDFKPAVPVTVTGLGFAGVGFLLGLVLAWPLLRLLGWPLRLMRRPAAAARVAPPVTAAGHATAPVAVDIEDLVMSNREPRRVLAGAGASQVAAMSIEPGGLSSGQVPAGGDMVLVLLEGGIRASWGSAGVNILAGQMAIVPEGAVYELRNESAQPAQIYVVEPRNARGARLKATR